MKPTEFAAILVIAILITGTYILVKYQKFGQFSLFKQLPIGKLAATCPYNCWKECADFDNLQRIIHTEYTCSDGGICCESITLYEITGRVTYQYNFKYLTADSTEGRFKVQVTMKNTARKSKTFYANFVLTDLKGKTWALKTQPSELLPNEIKTLSVEQIFTDGPVMQVYHYNPKDNWSAYCSDDQCRVKVTYTILTQ